MYIDNTYILSLDELKEIIESHTRNGKVDDEFRMEFIETFEDNTETGLLAFAESIETEGAKKYAEHLAALEAKWESLSASEQYTALVAFFNVTPTSIDLTKYIEITNVDIQDNEEVVSVNIAVKVKKSANESIRFEIQLYDEDNNVVRTIQTEYQSLAVRTNQELKFVQQIEANENIDSVRVLMGDKNIKTENVGRFRKFEVGGVEFKMIRVKGGKFIMGSDNDIFDEQPAHEVRLSDFFIAETPVTEALWNVLTDEREYLNGENYPKYGISWIECEDFIRKLNSKLKFKIGSMNFDFPTEAQWEYAARGGINKDNLQYSGDNSLRKVGWFEGNSGYRVHAVKLKSPNSLGIYDMSGNIAEWCKDRYYLDFYSTKKALELNPICTSGIRRVTRGGNCCDQPFQCRVTTRSCQKERGVDGYVGLRIILS